MFSIVSAFSFGGLVTFAAVTHHSLLDVLCMVVAKAIKGSDISKSSWASYAYEDYGIALFFPIRAGIVQCCRKFKDDYNHGQLVLGAHLKNISSGHLFILQLPTCSIDVFGDAAF